ncbi:hypothetical protein [Chondromyces crocatus]|uniref:Uncharacterized protein n=1 Tax=Chondromyces crocatus TaxID=52 RepID=A0A0K1E825_CHOCO|nr:hypothetical protein [Chondromyces crocatus]AKT37009.1 uncharacterized protein CMC5_011350 [Chondromyces crocatus]
MKPGAKRTKADEPSPQQKLRMPGSKTGTTSPDEEPDRFAWKGAAVVAALVTGLVVWRTCSPGAEEDTPGASSGPRSAESGDKAALAPPRCAPAGAAFVIDTEKRRVQAEGEEAQDQLAPFAVEVGRGAAFEGGFAVGALQESEAGAMAMVAFVGADGSGGRLVKLARSRGDLEPPSVTSAGRAVIVAMLEPNAGGRAIRVAKVDGDQVTWGAELAEGRDESLALDVAASGERAVVVWDDVTRDGKQSRIMMASLDTATLRSVTSPRPISSPKGDAEAPRLLSRPGGYWLAYVARGEERADDDSRGAGAKPGAKKVGTPARLQRNQEVLDEDTEAPGEMITHQWLEVMPLDETGSPVASARAITPRSGHVLAFDLASGDDGGVLLAYRDDDTPSGSSGGKVSVQFVGLGMVGEAMVVAGDERTAPGSAAQGVGSGVPSLLPGWLTVANISGATRLAALGPRGEILDQLAPEEALGAGEAIAANGGALMLARPAGTAVKLEVLRCARGEKARAAGEGEPSIPASADDVGQPRATDEASPGNP